MQQGQMQRSERGYMPFLEAEVQRDTFLDDCIDAIE